MMSPNRLSVTITSKRSRLGHEIETRRVDVDVVDRHLRELRADRFHRPGPQRARVGEHIRLVHQGQLPARPSGRPAEGIADDPLDAVPGVQAGLRGDLVRGPLAKRPADSGVRAFGSFAHDDDVDILRTHAGQGATGRRDRA